MKIKWNWGTGIFLAGAGFMFMLIIFAFFMIRQEFDLVENDYYPKALEYQQKIDRINNSRQLVEKIIIENSHEAIVFTFPPSFVPDSISGTIHFYRPSEKRGDRKISIDADSKGKMFMKTDRLLKGRYLIKVDYYYKNKGYYQEEQLILP